MSTPASMTGVTSEGAPQFAHAKPPRSLELEFTTLPPSENAIRQPRWIFAGGKKKFAGITYTAEAFGFQKTMQEIAHRDFFLPIQRFVSGHTTTAIYRLEIELGLPEGVLLNTGWPKAAKTPFKKLDVGNRRKLIEDSVAEAIGIDDSLFFEVYMLKFLSETPIVRVTLTEISPIELGVKEKFLYG